jgi:hypothetical protein
MRQNEEGWGGMWQSDWQAGQSCSPGALFMQTLEDAGACAALNEGLHVEKILPWFLALAYLGPPLPNFVE